VVLVVALVFLDKAQTVRVVPLLTLVVEVALEAEMDFRPAGHF
jgi:hypothetical protein